MINLEQLVDDCKNAIEFSREELGRAKAAFDVKYPKDPLIGTYYKENETEFERTEFDQESLELEQAKLNVRWAKLNYITALAHLDNSKLRLKKDIEDMTDAELQVFDTETAAKQSQLKATMPDNMVPMPTFQEQMDDLRKSWKKGVKESDVTDSMFAAHGGLSVDLYQVAPIETIFDANPAMNKAMADMRKFQSKSLLLVQGDKLVGLTAYLSVTFDDEMVDQAICAIANDLQILAEWDLIEGSLSLPKVMTLLNAKAIYVFPIINLDKLEAVAGIVRADIAIKFDQALKQIGIKTSAPEGEIGAKFKLTKVS